MIFTNKLCYPATIVSMESFLSELKPQEITVVLKTLSVLHTAEAIDFNEDEASPCKGYVGALFWQHSSNLLKKNRIKK